MHVASVLERIIEIIYFCYLFKLEPNTAEKFRRCRDKMNRGIYYEL